MPLVPPPTPLVPFRGGFRVRAGFTLLEVLAVTAVVAVLFTLSVGAIRGVKERAQTARARAELAALATDPVADFAHRAFPGRTHTAAVWAGSAAGSVATVSRGVSSVRRTQARVPARAASNSASTRM